MNPVRLVSAIVSLSFLLILTLVGAAGAQSGQIGAVRLAPDLSRVELRLDGNVGPHSAQVLESPSRLVIDFESAGLGKVPAKIRVGRAPVDEIRLGQNDARARLVIDFGQNALPQCSIARQNQLFVVSLGHNGFAGAATNGPYAALPIARQALPLQAPSTDSTESGPALSRAPNKSASGPPANKPPSSPPPNKAASGLSAKISGVTKDSVVVEMSDRKEPKRSYRLSIDFDHDALQVKRASISDFRGNVKLFDVIENEEVPATASGCLSSSAGPRKDWAASASAAQPKTRQRFKWGTQANAPSDPEQPKVVSRGPLRIEQFALQPSPTAR